MKTHGYDLTPFVSKHGGRKYPYTLGLDKSLNCFTCKSCGQSGGTHFHQLYEVYKFAETSRLSYRKYDGTECNLDCCGSNAETDKLATERQRSERWTRGESVEKTWEVLAPL